MPFIIEPLLLKHVDRAAQLIAISYSSSMNPFATALGFTAKELLPWARETVLKSIPDGLTFVLVDADSAAVLGINGGHFDTVSGVSQLDSSFIGLAPWNVARSKMMWEIASLARQHIHAGAARVFFGEAFKVVYSGPGAIHPSLVGTRAVRPVALKHHERVVALVEHSHVAVWCFCLYAGPALLVRLLDAAVSSTGVGAASDARLESDSSDLSCGGDVAPSGDWTQPPGVPAHASQLAPLKGWLRGYAKECCLPYVLKRIVWTYADFGHLHPGLRAMGSVPIELTVVLFPRRRLSQTAAVGSSSCASSGYSGSETMLPTTTPRL